MGLQVVKCQTKVKTVIGELQAIVTGICIRDEAISYELSYFHNGENKKAWVSRYEFTIDTARKQQAGFVKEQQPQEQDSVLILLPHD